MQLVDFLAMQGVSELREEVKNLRIEIDRLRKGTDAWLHDVYENQKHLPEMVKNLKEELDVDRVKRWRRSRSRL